MFWFGWTAGFGIGFSLLLALVMIWSLIWKGMALWKAGRNGQLGWFVILFIINTAGILDIIYLIWFQKKKRKR